MRGINFRVKSREATLADFKISLLFFTQFCTLGIYNEKLVLATLYSSDLIQNSGIKFSRKERNLQ